MPRLDNFLVLSLHQENAVAEQSPDLEVENSTEPVVVTLSKSEVLFAFFLCFVQTIKVVELLHFSNDFFFNQGWISSNGFSELFYARPVKLFANVFRLGNVGVKQARGDCVFGHFCIACVHGQEPRTVDRVVD